MMIVISTDTSPARGARSLASCTRKKPSAAELLLMYADGPRGELVPMDGCARPSGRASLHTRCRSRAAPSRVHVAGQAPRRHRRAVSSGSSARESSACRPSDRRKHIYRSKEVSERGMCCWPFFIFRCRRCRGRVLFLLCLHDACGTAPLRGGAHTQCVVGPSPSSGRSQRNLRRGARVRPIP